MYLPAIPLSIGRPYSPTAEAQYCGRVVKCPSLPRDALHSTTFVHEAELPVRGEEEEALVPKILQVLAKTIVYQ